VLDNLSVFPPSPPGVKRGTAVSSPGTVTQSPAASGPPLERRLSDGARPTSGGYDRPGSAPRMAKPPKQTEEPRHGWEDEVPEEQLPSAGVMTGEPAPSTSAATPGSEQVLRAESVAHPVGQAPVVDMVPVMLEPDYLGATPEDQAVLRGESELRDAPLSEEEDNVNDADVPAARS